MWSERGRGTTHKSNRRGHGDSGGEHDVDVPEDTSGGRWRCTRRGTSIVMTSVAIRWRVSGGPLWWGSECQCLVCGPCGAMLWPAPTVRRCRGVTRRRTSSTDASRITAHVYRRLCARGQPPQSGLASCHVRDNLRFDKLNNVEYQLCRLKCNTR